MLWFNKPSELAGPFDQNLFKVVLLLDALNPALERHVVARAEYLEELRLSSSEGNLLIQGTYILDGEGPASKLGYTKVHFKIELEVRECKNNDVILEVTNLRLRDPEQRKMDVLRLASKLVPQLRRSIIKSFTEYIPKILTPAENYSQIYFHTNYFLSEVPSFVGSLGEIKILNAVLTRGNRVNFYVHSNLILINLVNTFGPEFLALEEVRADKESQAMLWQTFGDES